MFLKPAPLGNGSLSPEVLEKDLSGCKKSGPCGAGRAALYLPARFALAARRCYLPWPEVDRVFKRVAMSQGGFTGKGAFGALAYLVVQYGGGKELVCRFRREEEVDRLLSVIREEHPQIPTHSAEATRKLAEAEAAEQARYLKTLPPEADAAVKKLREETDFLNKRFSFASKLTSCAKQKRITDRMSPAVRICGGTLGILGIAAALFGLAGLFTGRAGALYYIIGGAGIFFMTLATNTFPTRWNSKKAAQADWDEAVAGMAHYLAGRPSFSVPAQYAHPVVLERMIRVLREGRAADTAAALSVVKENLKALNSSVTVSQKEYDEVTLIKPLFLVCDYKDEL